MRYMFLLYADEVAGSEIPEADMAVAMDQMYAYADALKKADAFIATNALARTWDAKTVHRSYLSGVARDHGATA